MRLVGPTKIPICEKCGRVLKGRVPTNTQHITCFFCNNPPNEDEETATKYGDKL